MEAGGSVTVHLPGVHCGDPEAITALFERFFPQLIAWAHVRLWDAPRRAADEEDVALSAIDSFFKGARDGRFPQLRDRHDLGKILNTILSRKAIDLIERETCSRRGGGDVIGESDLEGPAGSEGARPQLDGINGRASAPEVGTRIANEFREHFGRGVAHEVITVVAEEFRRHVDALGDDELRQVAILHLEGYTNAEIAARIRRVERTVERSLALEPISVGGHAPTIPV